MADENNDSILESTKKLLGLPAEFDAFDQDVILHINSTFATLRSLGVGPDSAFSITDKASQWAEFIGDNPDIDFVRQYMYLKVRVVFDPPANSFTLDAFQKSIQELEFRLLVASEKEL